MKLKKLFRKIKGFIMWTVFKKPIAGEKLNTGDLLYIDDNNKLKKIRSADDFPVGVACEDFELNEHGQYVGKVNIRNIGVITYET